MPVATFMTLNNAQKSFCRVYEDSFVDEDKCVLIALSNYYNRVKTIMPFDQRGFLLLGICHQLIDFLLIFASVVDKLILANANVSARNSSGKNR